MHAVHQNYCYQIEFQIQNRVPDVYTTDPRDLLLLDDMSVYFCFVVVPLSNLFWIGRNHCPSPPGVDPMRFHRNPPVVQIEHC